MIGIPSQTHAAISVKSTFSKEQLNDVIENLGSVDLPGEPEQLQEDIWTGGFFFSDGKEGAQSDRTEATIATVSNCLFDRMSQGSALASNYKRTPSMIAIGENLLVQINQNPTGEISCIAYRCRKLAFGGFLGRLLDHIAEVRGGPDHALLRSLSPADFTPIEFVPKAT